MAVVRAQFGGVNSDVPAVKLPSGTATALPLNAITESGTLTKRAGFTEWETSAAGGSGLIGLFVAAFQNGRTYVVGKGGDGVLYQRQVYPTDAAAFTAITTSWTHSGSDQGWAYQCWDRWFYTDSGGSSRWHPLVNAGKAYRAGLPKPSAGPVVAAAQNGAKEGYYHAHIAYYNSKTREMGVVSEPSRLAGPTPGSLETRWTEGYGGISVTPPAWSGSVRLPHQYECDRYATFCSIGSTELFEGDGTEAEVVSWRVYLENLLGTANIGLGKADSYIMADPARMVTNEGGEPPAAEVGCYTGTVAVYVSATSGDAASLTWSPNGSNNDIVFTAAAAGTWGNRLSVVVANGTLGVTTGTNALGGTQVTVTAANGVSTAAEVIAAVNAHATASLYMTAANAAGNDGTGTVSAPVAETYLASGTDGREGNVLYSKREFPTMVPQVKTYTYSVKRDETTATEVESLWPRPFVGDMGVAAAGKITEAASVGGHVFLFTATQTWTCYTRGDGTMFAVKAKDSYGCVNKGAACETGDSVHALGTRCWTVNTGQSWQNIAQDRFTAVLEEIPAGYQTAARMAYHGYRDQVWCAVVKTGATVAQRILVWDRRVNGLFAFEPANLEADESITCMVELAHAGATPTMLVGTNKGRIYQYPSGSADDRSGTDYTYAASWQGIFAAEGAAYPMRLSRPVVHLGDNCNGRLVVKWRARRTADDAPTGESSWSSGITADRDNAFLSIATAGNQVNARMYEFSFSSAAEAAGTTPARWQVHDLALVTERTQ